MKRFAILTLQYYRSLLVYNLAFTSLIFFLFYFGAGITALIFLFAKIVGLICAFSLHYFSASQTYYYYRNAGYGIKAMGVAALGFDMLIYAALVLLYHLLPW